MKTPTLLIAAPHFGHPGHLGGIRSGRFQRWASEEGIKVIVVRAAGSSGVQKKPSGRIITIPDPFGFYRDPPDFRDATPPPPRRSNRLRQLIAYLLWVPDPLMPWARRVLRSSTLAEICPDPDWVLASSPPESSLVLAARLARRSQSRLLLDFRDGWLDESMIPLLNSSTIQRRRHARLEARVIRQAEGISLSSGIWREMLASRYPEKKSRMIVLPNSCPPDFPALREEPRPSDGPLSLLYAGKIHSSRPERRTRDLLDPLEATLPPGGRLIFRGNLSRLEIQELESRRGDFSRIDWEISTLPPVSRRELWDDISQADGLLMLSNSRASIPAKLFDYLPSGRPILAVTGRDSILDRLAGEIPRLFVYHGPGEEEQIDAFLRACREDGDHSIPERFSEAAGRSTFLNLLR